MESPDIEGLDEEQIALGHDAEFWQMIRERRKEPTISREEMERFLEALDASEAEDLNFSDTLPKNGPTDANS